jgi:hypothetical protein
MTAIDAVITWVNPDDYHWNNLRKEYSSGIHQTNVDYGDSRYRDFGTIRFVLRSLENYAKWFNRVYIVSTGDPPEWLNIENHNIRYVTHDEFIPKKYLPTFNSHCIEWNLHRIPGLSERFVYFNDDTILSGNVDESFFFRGNLPCREFVFKPIISYSISDIYPHIQLNNQALYNQNFQKTDIFKTNFRHIISFKWGIKEFLGNISSIGIQGIQNIRNPHCPEPWNLSRAVSFWDNFHDLLDLTCSSRFRSINDISPYVMGGFSLLSGEFSPRAVKKSAMYFDNFPKDIDRLKKSLKNTRIKMICINDSPDEDSNYFLNDVYRLLLTQYPNLSQFEK